MNLLLRRLLSVCLPLLLLSCDSSLDQDSLTQATKDIKESFKQGAKQLSDLTPSRDDISSATDEEVSKLFSFEYKVLELNRDLGAINIEAELNILGRERWECFDVDSVKETLTIYCRRRPKTYLRYVPRFFP